jgi:hypothetical protein
MDKPLTPDEELQHAAVLLGQQAQALADMGVNLLGHNVSLFVKVGPLADAALCLDCKADLLLTVSPPTGERLLRQHINGEWSSARPCPGRDFVEPEPDPGRF